MTIISEEPWPAEGIDNYNKIEDGEWGYLTYSEENGFQFDSSRKPPDDEILKRWGSRLKSMGSI